MVNYWLHTFSDFLQMRYSSKFDNSLVNLILDKAHEMLFASNQPLNGDDNLKRWNSMPKK